MVTGRNAGLGFELAKMLYCKGAKVYMASRTQSKAEAVIRAIDSTSTSTPGQLKFIYLDLSRETFGRGFCRLRRTTLISCGTMLELGCLRIMLRQTKATDNR